MFIKQCWPPSSFGPIGSGHSCLYLLLMPSSSLSLNPASSSYLNVLSCPSVLMYLILRLSCYSRVADIRGGGCEFLLGRVRVSGLCFPCRPPHHGMIILHVLPPPPTPHPYGFSSAGFISSLQFSVSPLREFQVLVLHSPNTQISLYFNPCLAGLGGQKEKLQPKRVLAKVQENILE